METTALRAAHVDAPLLPVRIQRRDLRPGDVDIRVTFCGVCHSDLHAIHTPAEAGGSFPLVPGHEFVGEVVAVGDSVTSFSVGDPVAVGNIVDSCGACRMCLAGQENFCEEFPTLTYGGRDRGDGTTTDGAYSGRYVVQEHFVYHRPAALDPAAVAPLMCAGVTVWEPLRVAGVGPGTRLGVVGLGGLGHLAVRLGRALGADVTVFTTTAAKADDAKALGASRVVVSTDPAAMEASSGSVDVIIDTVSVDHELEPYLSTLDLDGTLFLLGYLGPVTVQTLALLVGRKRLASGGSGGHRFTQELLDFCGEHDVVADVEVVSAADVAIALERLARNDVRYRFVLDMRDIDDLTSPEK
ncbi:NAD(P)-dependent alcohol dehydrogenase [Conyzicola nivalis]|uniref:alcohol dehydrogenase (NADP(+)) n=1 Tax=Conyzicola nivalis TaxID=1477021 RepID=A0A916SAC0_9MICO|nr:NAD(P)-dependent alcohol dehydrogenase [Conyzicola nivalis]GGA89507.1 NADP-dependent alcohol dehydrogenase [Conyzicola nivalis]